VCTWTRTLILAEVARLLVMSPTLKERNRVQRGPNLSSCDGTRTVPSRASRLTCGTTMRWPCRARPWSCFFSTPPDRSKKERARNTPLRNVGAGRQGDRVKSCLDASFTTLPGFHIRHCTPSKRTPQAIVSRASRLRQEVDLQCELLRETFVPRGLLLLLLINC
jgi:hypothetical protein